MVGEECKCIKTFQHRKGGEWTFTPEKKWMQVGSFFENANVSSCSPLSTARPLGHLKQGRALGFFPGSDQYWAFCRSALTAPGVASSSPRLRLSKWKLRQHVVSCPFRKQWDLYWCSSQYTSSFPREGTARLMSQDLTQGFAYHFRQNLQGQPIFPAPSCIPAGKEHSKLAVVPSQVIPMWPYTFYCDTEHMSTWEWLILPQVLT